MQALFLKEKLHNAQLCFHFTSAIHTYLNVRIPVNKFHALLEAPEAALDNFEDDHHDLAEDASYASLFLRRKGVCGIEVL